MFSSLLISGTHLSSSVVCKTRNFPFTSSAHSLKAGQYGSMTTISSPSFTSDDIARKTANLPPTVTITCSSFTDVLNFLFRDCTNACLNFGTPLGSV